MKQLNRAAGYWAAVILQVAIICSVAAPKVIALRTGRTVFLKMVPVDPYNIMSGYYATLSYDVSVPATFYPEKNARETTAALVAAYLDEVDSSPSTATLAQLELTPEDFRQHLAGQSIRNRRRAMNWTDSGDLLETKTLIEIRQRASWATSRNMAFPFADGQTVFTVLEEVEAGKPWKGVRVVKDHPGNLAPSEVALRGVARSQRVHYGIEQFYIPETERFPVAEALRSNIDNRIAEIRVSKSGTGALVGLHIGQRTWRNK